jgi:pimeloyl-ACP methyl ester carboxylesterase
VPHDRSRGRVAERALHDAAAADRELTALTDRVRAWSQTGELVELDGRRIFIRRVPGEGTPLLFLHGYPSSSYDWRDVLALLPSRQRLTLDFLGFGLSDKPRDHVYSLKGQADLVERLVDGRRVALIAHDMGTSVATELLARDVDGKLPFELASVLLFNGSIVLEAASLTVSQKILRSRFGALAARLSNERSFALQFKRIFAPEHPLSPAEAADQWSLLAYNDGHRIIDKLTYYLHERVTYAPRWHGALRGWPGELSLAWAGRDPVCTEAVLQAVLALRPRAPLTRWPSLGHYPQIDEPGSVAAVIEATAAA